MPLQRPLPSSQFLTPSAQPESTLTKSEVIVGFLQNLALPSVFHRELTEADYELWDRLLAPYSIQAIEYAFDNWGRNGSKFPQPKDIIALIDSYCRPVFEKALPSGRKPLDSYWPVWYCMFMKICERKEQPPLTDEEIAALQRESEDYIESRRKPA